MFFSKNKIDQSLQVLLKYNSYKKYRVLIKCKSFQDSILKKISSYKGSFLFSIESAHIIAAFLDFKGIDRISEYPEVEKIVLDEYLFLCGMSVSTANKAYTASKLSLSGKGITIGLVDSGIYPHPDLLQPSNRIVGFEDTINNLKYPYDDNGHGTAISGVILSSGISSNNLYKGIAPHSSVYCFKAFDKLGKGYASNILYSIESLINKSEEFNIKILCLPFELLNNNTFIINCFKDVFNKAVNKNIIPVVPSGSCENTPGSIKGISTIDKCITVGGVDTSKNGVTPYLYSSSGPFKKLTKPNLVSACCNISSLNCDTNYISEKNGFKMYPNKLETSYKSFTGTSFASAYVSGVCALLLEKNPNLNFLDITSMLKFACDDIEAEKGFQGDGFLNINKLFN